ncbi:hypothetical protein [Amycolatopsis sp. cmx-11-12]|uniref:hypothetical protein n=1 Tax=Amycolatopsis sp. cmx-11-12 TaxID=2785795 RepID=UPI0039176590
MLTERICHAGPRAGDGDDSGGYGLSPAVVFQSRPACSGAIPVVHAVHIGRYEQSGANLFTSTDTEHADPASRTGLAGRREAASLAP